MKTMQVVNHKKVNPEVEVKYDLLINLVIMIH